MTASPDLQTLGWDDGWASALAELADPTLRPGRVSRIDRGMCTLMTGPAEIRVAVTRGVEMAVGDWVAVDPEPGMGGGTRIVAVLPRRSAFRRATDGRGAVAQVVAANIDTVLLCDSLDGRLGLRHLERFLALAWQSGATPVVLMTKSDRVTAEFVAEARQAIKTVAAGVSVLVISSTTGEGIANLADYLVEGRTVALLGLSGAGKSTLANLLAKADLLATSAVRSDGHGRHTTTHRQLVRLPGGGLLIDTPGMRALSVVGAGEGVPQAFRDLEALALGCMYDNCSHQGEQGCEVAVAVSAGQLTRARLDSWLLLRVEPQAAARESARSAVEERKRRKAAKVTDRRAAKQ